MSGARRLEVTESGTADMISFAKLFLANPDLPKRLKEKARKTNPIKTPFMRREKKDTPIIPFCRKVRVRFPEFDFVLPKNWATLFKK